MSILAYALGIRVIHFCWIIFIAVWLLAAISAKRSVYRERRSERARYWLLLVIAYVLLQRAGSLPYPLDWLAVPLAGQASHLIMLEVRASQKAHCLVA